MPEINWGEVGTTVSSVASSGLMKSIDLVGKFFEIAIPLLTTVLGIAQFIIPLSLMGYGGYKFYFYASKFYKEAKGNEWMLIIRNGEMYKCGIGLCSWSMPGDQIVCFPSLLN